MCSIFTHRTVLKLFIPFLCSDDPAVIKPYYDESDISYETDSSEDTIMVQKSDTIN